MPHTEANAVQPRRRRSWIRWLLTGLATVFLLLVVFQGPILRAVVHAVAVKIAAGHNLKLDLRVEGGVLAGITLRNVHATATGPSAVQSLEADFIQAKYSLTNLAFHGMSDFLKDVEVRNVTAVLDPSKAPIPTPTPPPQPNEKVSLPAFFPDRLQITNVNLTIRGQPQDTVVKNLNLGLYPDREGELRIDKLQIPGVHTWTGITATTTYADKNLFLHNLTLDQENKLQMVNIDASRIGQGKVGVQFQGTIGGGQVASKIDLSTEGSTYQTNTNVHAKDISLGKLGEMIGKSPGEFSGDVKRADIDLRGSLNQPSSWDGTIQAEVNNVRQGKLALDDVKLDLVAADGKATVREARLDAGTNHVALRGSIDLPETTEGFGRTPGDFQIAIGAPDLKQLTGFLEQPVTGSLQASGNLKTENGIVSLDLKANGDLIGFDKAAVKKLTATISATKKMPPAEKKEEPIYEGLTTTVHAELSDVRYGDCVVDRVAADVKSDGATVSLAPLTVTRNNNILLVRGDFQLPPPNEELMKQAADLQFSLRAPQLGDYWQNDTPNKVTGELQADGNVRSRGGVASGQINLSGAQIAANKLLVRQVSAQAAIANSTVYLNDLTATLNEQDYINAFGTVKLQKPFPYTGAVKANLADLSAFEPLLATAEKKTPLAGSLVLNWDGQGEVSTFQNNGNLNLKLEHGRYADLKDLRASVEAHYTPQELNVPIVFVGSDKLNFQASLRAKGSTLEISNIQIDQGSARYATAYASLPFVWSNLGTDRKTFPPNGKVAINFQSENLDIEKLFRDLGAKAPVAGKLSVKLDAKGALEQLQGSLDLQLQNLKADAAAQLEPAKVNVAMRLQNNELKVDGKIEQAKIQPIQITARLPLNVSQVIANKKLDEQTLVQAKVVMPRSSVNFIREFVPALRQLDGTLALDVNVGGTIAKPDLRGAADMNINVARFENATLPALTNFKAQLNFRESTLSFDRFGGDLAGGPFTVSGRITLPKLTEPSFDLRLKANSVLVARNDDLTARVDADLKVEGPLQSASVSGEVLTTNSRFLKNIDIIPIGLPGRPAPQPEPPSTAPSLSFPNPPLRDWKFDIAIKSKDPFLIRGNLAAGSAVIDMKLSGTGLHPGLEGQVRLTSFEATLPFSTLTIRFGFLYFDPDDPLNPRIELQGESLIRDYTIHVYIYGTAKAPQAVFSSEPPLPQEEIISLLATGTTREELTGSGNVLASRAILLLGKELYRKIFKKGGDEEPKTDSIFNRLSVDIGNPDPRTGEQTATARYKVSDHVVLVGDLGVAGGFRGQVKYLIRFR
ncbi:MAG: translocation/assembly module TamB domain-containing protein [Chthoniobacterales bacterium]|nr:translocation/assembly module TamB domain-containing protein [Chthoniobacterales bacterium]